MEPICTTQRINTYLTQTRVEIIGSLVTVWFMLSLWGLVMTVIIDLAVSSTATVTPRHISTNWRRLTARRYSLILRIWVRKEYGLLSSTTSRISSANWGSFLLCRMAPLTLLSFSMLVKSLLSTRSTIHLSWKLRIQLLMARCIIMTCKVMATTPLMVS